VLGLWVWLDGLGVVGCFSRWGFCVGGFVLLTWGWVFWYFGILVYYLGLGCVIVVCGLVFLF